MTGRSLTDTVRAFASTQERLVPRVSQPDFSRDEWSPLTEFVDVEAFQRVGTEMEVQNWDQFLDMLTNWASRVDGFDAVVRGTSELPGIVYFEVEEHHRHGGGVMVVNSLSVFEFDRMNRISQIRVYIQRAPTGR
jgi:hypothetical protein